LRTVEREGGDALPWRRVESGFERCVTRITRCMTPARAVGVERDVGPVGVVERYRGAFDLDCVGLIRDEPLVPDVARECATILTHELFAPRRGHQPVVPVVLRLPIGERLARRVGAV